MAVEQNYFRFNLHNQGEFMKKITVALLLTFSFGIAQASTILKAVTSPGFIRYPEIRTFMLDSSGLMQMKIVKVQTGVVQYYRLGQLSPHTINKLRAEVLALDTKSPLVDDNPGSPRCLDAGGLSVSIIKNRAETEIYRQEECHEFHLTSYEGQHLIKLAMGFIDL